MTGYARRKIPSRALIDVQSDDDVRSWAELLGVSEEEIVRAARAVGPSVEAVRDYLFEEE